MTYRTLTQRARNVRLVILDVDGVLTDGSIWTGENGELVKRFFTRDGLGIKMLQAAGIGIAMGNANPKAKAAADYVCGSIDEDGLYHFCKEMEWI